MIPYQKGVKILKKIVSLILCLFLITGCFKRDTMEGIDIYTTIYPIEYITNRLYAKRAVLLTALLINLPIYRIAVIFN